MEKIEQQNRKNNNNKNKNNKKPKKNEKNGKYVKVHLWCLSQCRSSKLQLAHGKGKGSIILTKQNKTSTM